MRRTGRLTPLATLLLLCSAASAGAAEVEFHQTVDRTDVGTDDTFRLTVVVGNAPADSELSLPASDDFEILSTGQSSQFSYSMGGGSGRIMRLQKYTLVMRANRAGRLTIPPSRLKLSRGSALKTEAVTLDVKQGSRGPAPRTGRSQRYPGFPDPFGDTPFDDDLGFPTPNIPRSDSDLFLKAVVSSTDVYVGEQLSYSLLIYARVDLTSVDAVTMPKFEGFWSEDLESPTQLSADDADVGGVPYRVYVLRRRALFPMHAGTLTIEPASSEISTGFVFSGRRVTRKSERLTVQVKELPPGRPAALGASDVGKWRLSMDASATNVKLGDPVEVRVALEGTGNLKNVTPPKLVVPPGLRAYEPSSSDKPANTRTKIAGRREHAYVVLAQQTGRFTLPPLRYEYFDPTLERYATSTTEELTFTVRSADGAPGTSPGTSAGTAAAAKNVLSGGGLRPLRAIGEVNPPAPPVSSRAWYGPLLAAPFASLGVWAAARRLRAAGRTVDPRRARSQQLRAAQQRLAAAQLAAKAGKTDESLAETEKALLAFLTTRLGVPVQGLARTPLAETLRSNGVADAKVKDILRALELCELGRYARGAGGNTAEQAMAAAERAMANWEETV